MQRIAKNRRRNRTKYVALALAALAIIVIASIVILTRPGQPSRPKATDYLRIAHSKSLGEFAEPDASVLYLKQVGIDVTAVGGNASSILIDVDGLVPEGEGDYNYFEFLPEGETWSAVLPLSNMYIELDQSTGLYAFEINHIGANEVEAEPLTLHISPDDIVSSTQRRLTILPSTNGRTVMTSPSTDGYTTGGNVSYWFNLNRNITLSAVPDSGFVFDYWIINSQNITATPYTFAITIKTTVEAYFKPQA